MPELPEVETIRLGLQQFIVGKKIKDLEVLTKKTLQGKASDIRGAKILKVERRAKVLRMILSNKCNLLFHLKMTGQLIYRNAKWEMGNEGFAGGHPSHDWHADLPNKHTRLIFDFTDGSKLFFNDMRKFGWCKILNDTDLTKKIWLSLGTEPFGKEFTVEYLIDKAKRVPNCKIKQFLTDQTIIAGIGNIYADEILFDARLSPTRQIKNIDKSEWKAIINSTRVILKKAIRYGGTTDSDYVKADGTKGGMQNHLKVYRRTDEKCFGCKGVVKRIVIGGRGTHYCPDCQK